MHVQPQNLVRAANWAGISQSTITSLQKLQEQQLLQHQQQEQQQQNENKTVSRGNIFMN